MKPFSNRFAPAERRLIRRLRTPLAVQRFLNRLPYNTEPRGDTLHSFRQVVRRGTAHCLEAALFAACVLEQHGHPPLLMGLENSHSKLIWRLLASNQNVKRGLQRLR